MPEFNAIDDLVRGYVSQNADACCFVKRHNYLCLKSFKEFLEIYYRNNKSLGAKFSERVFSYWLYNYFKDFEYFKNERFSPSIRVQEQVEIKMALERDCPIITKRFDVCLLANSKRVVLIEFKANIDMVEKDLYKFYLLNRFYEDKNIKKVFLIFENENNAFNRRNQPGHYLSLLELAKEDKIIDEFIYLPGNDGNYLENQIKKIPKIFSSCKFSCDSNDGVGR